MRVGFGICKDCGDAGRLKYGARRSRVMRSGSNMGPGGQGEGGAQWAFPSGNPFSMSPNRGGKLALGQMLRAFPLRSAGFALEGVRLCECWEALDLPADGRTVRETCQLKALDASKVRGA